DEQDVRLIDFHVISAVLAEAQTFVVVVDRDREDLFGPVLTDDVTVELVLDVPRRGDVRDRRLAAALAALLVVDDRLAELDALAADVNVAGAFNERPNVAVALATKRAVRIAIAAGASGRSPAAAI